MEKENVLIVSSQTADHAALDALLGQDYALIFATGQQTALAWSHAASPPGLILIEAALPPSGGYNLCRMLKAEEQTRHIPVIFISDDLSRRNEKEGLASGGVDYLLKPFSPALIRARIKTHLELKNHRQHMEALIQERTAQITEANRKLVKEIAEREKIEADLKKSQAGYRSFANIGLALSIEKNINRLLEMIVDESRFLSHADAGTLYSVDPDKQHLTFMIMQNDTMGTRMGGKSGDRINLPKVPLFLEGKPNHANVSSCVALTGRVINIEDVYQAQGFDFTGPKKYDAATGYRSQSMLVIPMLDHESEIIGVLQLLNAKNPESGEVTAFSPACVDLVASLASQAAVALDNAQLIDDLKSLFDAFIRSIATAIDEKSPYTGGHINRVVDLTMRIADKINQSQEGPFADVHFNEYQIEELRLAAWMHDVGKITTPEYVVDKGTKLETLFDRILLVKTRFELALKATECDALQRRLALISPLCSDALSAQMAAIDAAMHADLDRLRDDLKFVEACNQPGEYMSDDHLQRINAIAARTYTMDGERRPMLTANECYNLSIRKGSLTTEERHVIENHVRMTEIILNQLPFPKHLNQVPLFAASHHERLDGGGYHQGLTSQNLPLQARILAVADIFEALSAADRPYRKPMTLSQIIKIMDFMQKNHHIDPDLMSLFLNTGIHIEYGRERLKREQIDL